MAKEYTKQFAAKPIKKANLTLPELPIWFIPVCVLIIVITGLWVWHHKTSSTIIKNTKTNVDSTSLNFEFSNTSDPLIEGEGSTSNPTSKSTITAIKPISTIKLASVKIPAAITNAEQQVANNKSIPVVTAKLKTTFDNAKPYSLQLASFQQRVAAEKHSKQLGNIGTKIYIIEDKVAGKTVYRVMAGPFVNQETAKALQTTLAKSKIKSILHEKNSKN